MPPRRKRSICGRNFFRAAGVSCTAIRSANPERNGIYVGSLDSPEKVRVLASTSRATYAAGFLVFAQDRALAARAFDPQTLKVGATLQIDCQRDRRRRVRAAERGTPDLPAGQRSGTCRLVRQGRVARRQPRNALRSVRRCVVARRTAAGGRRCRQPDRRHLAVRSAPSLPRPADDDRQQPGLVARRQPRGVRVVPDERRAGAVSEGVVRQRARKSCCSRADPADTPTWPHDWSPDGRYIVYTSASPKSKMDLWLLSMADRKPIPYLQTPISTSCTARCRRTASGWPTRPTSPGTWEVYVQSFPVPGHRRTISTDWRRAAALAKGRQRAVLPRVRPPPDDREDRAEARRPGRARRQRARAALPDTASAGLSSRRGSTTR